MLPFLVVHGPLIWKLSLVVFTIGAVAIGRTVVRRRERRRFSEALRLLRAGITELRQGHVVLLGIFHGRARSVSTGDRGVTDAADGASWVELEDGTRLDLQGPIRIAFGARAEVSLLGRRRRVDEIRDGDVVVVRGLASLGAATEDGEYRESAGRWTLRTDPAFDEPLTVTAGKPAIRSRWMGPVIALTAVLAGGVGYLVVQCIDLHPEMPESTTADAAFSAFDNISLAAVFPRSRERALHVIERTIADRLDRSERVDALSDELDALLDEPCGKSRATYHRLAGGRFEAALELARGCAANDPAARSALLALARYDEAFAIPLGKDLDDATNALVAAIATGRPEATSIAQRARDQASDTSKLPYACLAAGVGGEQPAGCKSDADYGVDPKTPFLVELVMGPGAYAWLVQWVQDPLIDDPRRMHLVAIAIVRGDFAAARTAAGALRDRGLTAIALRAIQLRSGTPLIGEADESDNAAHLWWGYPPRESEGCAFLGAIRFAWRDGDAAPIAAILRRRGCSLDADVSVVSRLLDVLPHVTRGKAELAEAVRTHPRIYWKGTGPTERAAEASLRRDLARLLGDQQEAERQTAIVQRATAALNTRERVVAFRQLQRAF